MVNKKFKDLSIGAYFRKKEWPDIFVKISEQCFFNTKNLKTNKKVHFNLETEVWGFR